MNRILFCGFSSQRFRVEEYISENFPHIQPVGFVVKNYAVNERPGKSPVFSQDQEFNELMKHNSFPNLSPSEFTSLFNFEHELYIFERAEFKNSNHLMLMQFAFLNCSYANHILEDTNPDIVFFDETPHNPFAIALYRIAKAKSKKVIITSLSAFGSIYQAFIDYKMPNKRILSVSKNSSIIRQNVLSEFLFSSFIEKPYYVQNLEKKFSGIFNRFRTSFHKNKFSIKAVENYVTKQVTKSHYNSVVTIHNKSELDKIDKPIIYFPLHYQPERTTMPEGGVWANQLFCVSFLSRLFGDKAAIIIKEHPSQFFFNGIEVRTKDFYKCIADFPNVHLLSLEISSLDIMDRVTGIATITGRVGMEGLIHKIPVGYFGYPKYIGFPNSFDLNVAEEVVNWRKAVLAKEKRDFELPPLNSEFLYGEANATRTDEYVVNQKMKALNDLIMGKYE